MKLSHSIQSNIWCLILLNILMAFVGIKFLLQIMKIAAAMPCTTQCDMLKMQCSTGAWLLVFMAFIFFLASLTFLRSVKRLLIKPIENIENVLHARELGDNFRRCPNVAPRNDILKLYHCVNKVLDNK